MDRSRICVPRSPFNALILTWRLLSVVPCLDMSCFLVRACNILPKKELHRSLRVAILDTHPIELGRERRLDPSPARWPCSQFRVSCLESHGSKP